MKGFLVKQLEGHVQRIDAITFATANMAESVNFYQALGFVETFGDSSRSFVTLESASCFVNLWLVSQEEMPTGWWGRIVFHVDDVDEVGDDPDPPPPPADHQQHDDQAPAADHQPPGPPPPPALPKALPKAKAHAIGKAKAKSKAKQGAKQRAKRRAKLRAKSRTTQRA